MYQRRHAIQIKKDRYIVKYMIIYNQKHRYLNKDVSHIYFCIIKIHNHWHHYAFDFGLIISILIHQCGTGVNLPKLSTEARSFLSACSWGKVLSIPWITVALLMCGTHTHSLTVPGRPPAAQREGTCTAAVWSWPASSWPRPAPFLSAASPPEQRWSATRGNSSCNHLWPVCSFSIARIQTVRSNK